MKERVEWEVVDERPPGGRPSMQQLMEGMLGRWWRWKIAGGVAVAALAIVLLVTVAGIFMLFMAAVGLASIGVGVMRRWLRKQGGSDQSVTVRRNTGDSGDSGQ